MDDWRRMRDRCAELARELIEQPPPVDEKELTEVKAFLDWLVDDNFTFLGYREYELQEEDGEAVLECTARLRPRHPPRRAGNAEDQARPQGASPWARRPTCCC